MRLKINPLFKNMKRKKGKIQGLAMRKQGKLPRLTKRKPKHLKSAKNKAMKAMTIKKFKNKVILSMIAADICKTPRKVIRAILQDLI